ncbi:MAG: marine proteobacterial sortase target protein [Gammaproteobacteria bacterium]|nr:marine proteobacterial sortase target protein [Gammaproteobacteria bacterium]MDH3466450.1 marine proteobacterial sortase target protein [Gammaproteobacteria bacterium]
MQKPHFSTASCVAVVLVVLTVLTSSVRAQAESSDTVVPEQMGHGALLLRTDQTGRYREATALSTNVEMRVTGLIASVTVTQSFTNQSNDWLEGIYVFPLPDDAAVHGLTMRIGKRTIKGLVKPRNQAKRQYQQAKKSGKRASLVEQERPNMFTTSVANIGPGTKIDIEIDYQQTVVYADGEFRLRFPMVVGPRYIPGRPVAASNQSGTGWAYDTDQVTDASRITPPVRDPRQGPTNRVTLRAEVDAGFAVAEIDSPYHAVQIKRKRDHRFVVKLDSTTYADRDFELSWIPTIGHAPRAALFTETVDGEHYALVLVMPPNPDASERSGPLPRETVFVIDTSGSMAGDSLRQAKAGLQFALDRLTARDTFNVIQFSSTTRQLFQQSQPATADAIRRAKHYVTGLRANGGTKIAAALRASLNGGKHSGRLRQVFFLTDGSVGNEPQLFELIQSRLGDSRLFTIGIGSAPNAYFMSRAARFGRGTFTFIGKLDEVTDKMQSLFAKLEQPLLADIDIDWPDGLPVEATPNVLPDLYHGEPVTIVAKLPQPPAQIDVSGRRRHQPWRFTVDAMHGKTQTGIGRLWARRTIRALLEQPGSSSDDKILLQERVVDLALRHQLVTRYTSLVTVDVTPVRPRDRRIRSHPLATNLPKGWSYKHVFGALPATATDSRLLIIYGLIFVILSCVGFWMARNRA